MRTIAKTELDSSGVNRDSPRTASSYVSYFAAAKNPRTVLQMPTGSPVTVGVPEADWSKTIHYEYKCRRCGHKWFEISAETHEGRPDKGYTGD